MCPQASQSPVLQERITGIPKPHVSVTLSSDKTVRFEMLWGYVLRNNNVTWKRTNPILIVSDLLGMRVSWIFLKCFLICAILPSFSCYNPFHAVVNSLPLLLLLTLLHIPYIFQIALQTSSHRALMDQILHNKNQSTNIAFWSWRSRCSLLTMLGQDFLCWSKQGLYWSKHWLSTVFSRSPHTLSKYDCFMFSIHLNDKIRNNIIIQINHQVFAPLKSG